MLPYASHHHTQDTPGYGDDVNLAGYLETITSFLLKQQEEDYKLLDGSRCAMSGRGVGRTACKALRGAMGGCKQH